MSNRNSPRHESNNNWMRTPMDRFVRGGQTINLQIRETIHLIKIMLWYQLASVSWSSLCG